MRGGHPIQAMDTACESLQHSFMIKYRWLNAGETLSRTLGNSCVSSVSSHRFTLPYIRLLVSVITTYGYELYLCYVRGEQLDKLCFSASHLIRYWKMYNYVHMQCLCILCIFWEIKHLNLNLNLPEQKVEQTIKSLVILDPIALIMSLRLGM